MRCAVLGSGPSGFYAAQVLLKRFPSAHVDILEHLPVPFGLVRYGVAPDHPATKSVITGFTRFVENNLRRVRFLGNIPTLERADLSLHKLNEMYHLTIIATGANRPRTLPSDFQISSEVFTAHNLILWLNGHPHLHERERLAKESNLNSMESMLRKSQNLAVIGQGNVAVDVARLLLRPIEDLRGTDISPTALSAIESCSTRSVSLIGRRSPRYASWTTAALREVLTKIPGITTRCNHELILSDLDSSDLSRITKRTLKLILESTTPSIEIGKHSKWSTAGNKLHLEFLMEPHSIEQYSRGLQIKFSETQMNDRGTPVPTGRFMYNNFDAAILSLGYIGGFGDGIRVGWANGNARGIIGDNLMDARTVIERITHHSLDCTLSSQRSGIDDWISENDWHVVDWDGWKRIDEEERRRGSKMGGGRERVKIESIDELLSVSG